MRLLKGLYGCKRRKDELSPCGSEQLAVSTNDHLMKRQLRLAGVSGFQGISVSKTRLNVLCLIKPLVLFNPRHESQIVIVTAGRIRPRQQQRPGA
jgi:hypothetical protein